MANNTGGVTYQILERVEERWDGSDETAAHFGYGDYRNTTFVDVGQVTARTKRMAYAAAKRLLRDPHIRFSGVGYTHVLRETNA